MLSKMDVHQRISPILDEVHKLIEELQSDQELAQEQQLPFSKERSLVINTLFDVDLALTDLYLTLP